MAEACLSNHIHSQHFHMLDKTRGNLCLLYIDPRKVQCLLLDHAQVSEFSPEFVDGLTTLGETVLYGVYTPPKDDEAFFSIYDFAIVHGENICDRPYSKRREGGESLLRLYKENRGKGNITSKLRLLLKKPCVPINRRNEIKSAWKRTSNEVCNFEWGNTSLPSEGVILIPENTLLFPHQEKKQEFPPLIVWAFPYLVKADFHIRIPFSDPPELMAYDPKKKCLQVIQARSLPPQSRNILQLAQESSKASNPNISAVVMSCRYDPRFQQWYPIKQSDAIKPCSIREMISVKSVACNAIHWDTFRGAPPKPRLANPDCHSCNIESKFKYLYLPAHDRYASVLKHLNINQNKKKTMELIATPKLHVEEFRNIDAKQPGFLFWWSLMKFIHDQLFSGKCANNPQRTPLTSKVTLEISYGNWITHRHAHVHIQMEEYMEAMQKLGFPELHVNRTPLDSTEGDCTEEVLAFRDLDFKDWCWKSPCFNHNPIFEWIYKWLGKAIPGFTFQIVLTKNLVGPLESEFFVRVNANQAATLQRLLSKPPTFLVLKQ